MSNDKAVELVNKYGKEIALEIANMIYKEHYEYALASYVWRGGFGETCTNADRCKYWADVIDFIDNAS
jgi:hypothetical protein